MVTSHSVNNKPNSRLGIYQYDELNRIRKTQNKVLGYSDLTTNTANANPSTPWANNAPWNEDFTYDANGNIETLKRNDETGSIMDNLTYSYPASDFANQPTNRLNKVTDNTDKTGFDDFRPGQENDNYLYDASGNLRKDAQEQLDQIIWTPANKMEFLKKVVGDETIYNYRIYDGTGQLVLKWATKFVGASTTETPVNGEEYVRDPQGNVMATYQLNAEGARTLTEQTIYGSSRLGTFTSNTTILVGASDELPTAPTIYSKYGNRKYEISNQLGNVLAVVSDEKDANGKAIVLDKQDYYAFGSPLPKNNEAAMVLFEGNYAQETTSNNNSGWKEGNAGGVMHTIANTGVQIPTTIGKGARKPIDLLRDREYTFTANFSNLPTDIMTYPITVEIINKANNEVLLQRTTTTSNIEFGFKAPITGDAEVKIYHPSPEIESTTDYYLTYAKLSKAAYNFPASVPASEIEVISNFNVHYEEGDNYLNLPINNAGWDCNASSSIQGMYYESDNQTILLVNNNNSDDETNINKSIYLGPGTYTLNATEFHSTITPISGELGYDSQNNPFEPNHILGYAISGTDISSGGGSNTFTNNDVHNIAQTFTVANACTVNIVIWSNSKHLAIYELNLKKTVPATTPITNSWASSNYRYGFNGKENMKEAYSMGVLQDYGFRLYNSHIARFLSIDPLRHKYPELTTYQFAGNMPIKYIDLDGLEPANNPDDPANQDGRNPTETINTIFAQSGGQQEYEDNFSKFMKGTFDVNKTTNYGISNKEGYTSDSKTGADLGNLWVNNTGVFKADDYKDFTLTEFSNFLLGNMINGTGPENIEFPINGTVSNYMKDAGIVNDAMASWYSLNQGRSSLVGGKAEFSGNIHSPGSFLFNGMFHPETLVGSATVTITPINANEVMVRVFNVTSLTSGDFIKHFPWSSFPTSVVRDPSKTSSSGANKYGNISQLYQFTLPIDPLLFK